MSKYEKYIPLGVATLAVLVALIMSYNKVFPLYGEMVDIQEKAQQTTSDVENAKKKLAKLKLEKEQTKNISEEVTKKIYYPSEADLDKDSLFFSLYTDVIDIAKQNQIKIRSIDYKYYPPSDPFVTEGGKENYFVCDLDMKLISNYRQLRNFISTLFQYPFYIKFNKLSVVPYKSDKRLLFSDFSIRLYAHTDIEKPLP